MNTKRTNLTLLLMCAFTLSAWTQSLVINEFMADNDELTGLSDEAGQYDDWVEIYNGTSAAINLGGYFLSDKLDDLEKWTVPAGTNISQDGYLVFWTDDDTSQGPLHTNFKLSKSGESIYLTDPSGMIVDSVNYGAQTTSISSARIPNGTGDFIPQAPTFKYDNEGTAAVHTPLNEAAFSISPNPASDLCTLTWTESDPQLTLDVSVWDPTGKMLFSKELKQASDKTDLVIPLQQFISGTYYVQLLTKKYHAVKVLVVK